MKNWKKRLGEAIGNIFTSNPEISEEAKAEVFSALNEGSEGDEGSEPEANLQSVTAEKEALAGQVSALTAEKEALTAQVTALTAEKEALATQLATAKAESTQKAQEVESLQAKLNDFESIKAQMDTYKAQVLGIKPEGERSGKVVTAESYEDKQANLERLKEEFKYSSAGL